MNATIDVGENLTSLLERLAQQIGTTADKIFPWYVQQAYIEGVTTLCAIAIMAFIMITVFAFSVKRADFKDGNVSAVVTVCSGIILIFTTVAVPLDGVNAVRKIINPQYYAVSMLTKDVGRLAGK